MALNIGRVRGPSSALHRRLSARDECLSLLVLSEMPIINLGFKRSYSAMTDKPDEIPSILSRGLLRIPELNQRGHVSTVAVSLNKPYLVYQKHPNR
jgi:hypothetical protein